MFSTGHSNVVYVLILLCSCTNMIWSQTDHTKLVPSYIVVQSDMTLNPNGIEALLAARPSAFKTYISDRTGQQLEVRLESANHSSTKSKSKIYYQGILVGKEQSLVTLTISHDKIEGLLADASGQYNFTTINSKIEEVTNNRKSNYAWVCDTDTKNNYKTSDNKQTPQKAGNRDTLGIYFVCDYALYNDHNQSKASVIEYVNNMFLQVHALYKKADINVKIADIFIWESPDPYSKSSSRNALASFKESLANDFPGSFAHLLSTHDDLEGGVAYLNALCNREKAYGFSKIHSSISEPGVYSWDVHVVAHEIGHNIGSPHTHDCAWGPDGDKSIDACGGSNANCPSSTIPSAGGTIMSYCHTSPSGVNFSLGFGEEPTTLLQSKIQECIPSDGQDCSLSSEITKSQTTITVSGITAGAGAYQSNATHARWYRYEALQDGVLTIQSCGQGVDTRLFVYTGTCDALNKIANSDDNCISSDGLNYASEVIGLPINEGATVYIEWDDRWSDIAFDFTFLFEPSNPTCNNGVKDPDEEGIDCGGLCAPCLDPCSEDENLPDVIDNEVIHMRSVPLTYDGTITKTGSLTMQSSHGFELSAGFEINNNGVLEAKIGDCKE